MGKWESCAATLHGSTGDSYWAPHRNHHESVAEGDFFFGSMVAYQLRNWDSKTQWYIKTMFGTAPRFTNGAVFFCFDSTSSLTSGAQAVLVKKRLAKPLFMVDKKGWNILNILLFSLFLFFILFFFFLRLFPVVVPSPFGPPPPTTLLLLCPSRAGVSFFFGMLSSYR